MDMSKLVGRVKGVKQRHAQANALLQNSNLAFGAGRVLSRRGSQAKATKEIRLQCAATQPHIKLNDDAAG
jgi:hypothetical protein